MFYCEFCGRAFTRKFNLRRHLKTKHSSSNNRNGTKNIIVDEHNNNSIVNDHNVSNTTNKTDNNNNSGINNINDENKDNNEPLPLEINSFIQEFPGEKEGFNQRMLAATEAIKQKFNLLRNTSKGIHNFKSTIPTQQKQEEASMNVVSDNNTTRLEAKLPELLQCMLDILMIKELQNVEITKEGKETVDEKDKNVKLKRRFSSVNEQEIEDEIKSLEEIPLKHLKFDNTIEYEDDNSSISSECVVKKYWHDPNTLVDELRNLISTTDIGQQISTILQRLNEKNIKSVNYFEYVVYKEKRGGLIRNLNELKKTSVGQQIFGILNKLEKIKIIDPIDYTNNEVERLSDEEANYITDDIDESVTTGEGLCSQPRRSNEYR